MRKKGAPVSCCTGAVASAYDAQSTVAVCRQLGSHVLLIGLTVAEKTVDGLRRCFRVALTPPTFALQLGDAVFDFDIGPVVKLIGNDLAEQFDAGRKCFVRHAPKSIAEAAVIVRLPMCLQ